MAERTSDYTSQPTYSVTVNIGGEDPGEFGIVELLQRLVEAGDDQELLKAAKQIVDTVESFE